MDFGPFGLSEVVFIGLLALVLFGPRRLPELARSVGSALTALRRGTEELKRTFQEELDAADGGLSGELEETSSTLRSLGEEARALGESTLEEGRRLVTGRPTVARGRLEADEPKEGAEDDER